MTEIPTLMMNDGRAIPQLGYGVFQIDPAETAKVTLLALETGYRSIDTAQAYRNEAGVGDAVASCGIDRGELFITTKLWNSNQPADKAMSSFDQSLRKLRMDYVDLFLIHWPQPMFDEYVDAWKIFEKIQADGRAKSIGVSNFNEAHLQRLFDETEVVPAVNQIELHPGFPQESLRTFNVTKGILTEAWSPIGQGGDLLQNETLVGLADRKGKSPAQIVLRWHVQSGNVVIPKSVTPSRIKENIELFDFELDAAEMAQIDAIPGSRMGPDPETFDRR